MSAAHLDSSPHLTEADLIARILAVRYTDLEEEKRLCLQLLQLTEPVKYAYSRAFAHVYLVDSCLALGDYDSCAFYLAQAELSCRENVFDNLLMTLCNQAGLYYLNLGDELTALRYFLEGVSIARREKDDGTLSKLLNNIALAFSDRGDWETARDYFQQACFVAGPLAEVGECPFAVSYLTNLAEACRSLGDATGAKQALELCQALGEMDDYNVLRLKCGWLGYYAMCRDGARCSAAADELIELGLLEYENKYFVCDMVISLCEGMLDIGDQVRAARFLDRLQQLCANQALVIRYQAQCLCIRYLEQFGSHAELTVAYRAYCALAQELSERDEQARAQNMISKIQMTNLLAERQNLRRESRELRGAGQLDELTGLYNRRHLNKLMSKSRQSSIIRTIGFVMLDVDYFKQFNDHYGHFLGDSALKLVSGALRSQTETGIIPFRYGGDEFVCLCINHTDREIDAYVDRVRGVLAEAAMPHAYSKSGDVLTVSVGYSNAPMEPGVDLAPFLRLADEALYQAKEGGRNRKAAKFPG